MVLIKVLMMVEHSLGDRYCVMAMACAKDMRVPVE